MGPAVSQWLGKSNDKRRGYWRSFPDYYVATGLSLPPLSGTRARAIPLSSGSLTAWPSLKQLIETVEAHEQRKIGFKSLTEAIDTTRSGGRLIFHIFAALAEFERSIIRERTLAGLSAAKARASQRDCFSSFASTFAHSRPSLSFAAEVGDPEFCRQLIASHPTLISGGMSF